MIVRTSIDPITGKLTDSRPKYLGAKPVRLVKMEILGKPAILGLSSRPWLFYTFGRKQMTSLLAFPFISVATAIKMSTFNHTIMAFSENHLRIIRLENFGSIFHCEKIPLDYSAKKLMVFDKNLAIIESLQVWQEGKKDVRVWNSKLSVINAKEGKKIEAIDMDED
jgi:splicing factor 3B subunit 3